MRRVERERGGATVFVAILLVVLVGMVAFAVDAGALYQERRELQNAADAASLAIAEDCALNIQCDYFSGLSTAYDYADANSSDNAAEIDDLTIDMTAQTVEVLSSTLEAESGATVLAPIFAQILGFNGSTVRAEATAAWGYASELRTLPIIFSDCEWRKYGLPAGPLQPGPTYTGSPSTIYFHGSEETCHASPSGQDMPGGFGWLDSNGFCEATVEVGTWVGIDPGASPPNDCDPTPMEDIVGTIQFIPFFDDILGTGNNATYHVAGFAALYVTGYNFGGQYKEVPGSVPCSGNDRCIAGYFTTGTAGDGGIGGDNRGVVVVKLIG